MKLKNILIVVKDIEKSKKFYHDLFGLDVILDQEGNAVLTEGLVLQEKTVWEEAVGQKSVVGNAGMELYFEETDMAGFRAKLRTYPEEIRCLTPPEDGEELIRLYDPDGHLIEIRKR